MRTAGSSHLSNHQKHRNGCSLPERSSSLRYAIPSGHIHDSKQLVTCDHSSHAHQHCPDASFFNSTMNSPGGSDTCSSWNLSPYPALLDMTQPSTLLQPGYAWGDVGHNTPLCHKRTNSTREEDENFLQPRRMPVAALRNRIPHVSHFSVPRSARSDGRRSASSTLSSWHHRGTDQRHEHVCNRFVSPPAVPNQCIHPATCSRQVQANVDTCLRPSRSVTGATRYGMPSCFEHATLAHSCKYHLSDCRCLQQQHCCPNLPCLNGAGQPPEVS